MMINNSIKAMSSTLDSPFRKFNPVIFHRTMKEDNNRHMLRTISISLKETSYKESQMAIGKPRTTIRIELISPNLLKDSKSNSNIRKPCGL